MGGEPGVEGENLVGLFADGPDLVVILHLEEEDLFVQDVQVLLILFHALNHAQELFSGQHL